MERHGQTKRKMELAKGRTCRPLTTKEDLRLPVAEPDHKLQLVRRVMALELPLNKTIDSQQPTSLMEEQLQTNHPRQAQ